MSRNLPVSLLFTVALAAPATAHAQAVVVDQGTFSVEIDGSSVGTEEFSIRRAGLGNQAVFIASGVVTVQHGDVREELRPLLQARADVGASHGYELDVVGSATLEIKMNAAGPRFISRFESELGQEEREFRARPDSRIVERHVAHHFFFLRNLGEGDTAPVIVPRDREEVLMTVEATVDEEIRIGRSRVPARRVSFASDGVERLVWFDRQGRVLRVEVPSEAYVAVRTDLVG